MLSDTEVKSILDQEIESSIGYFSGELSQDRQDALDFYNGEPVGELAPPAVPGRSQVVSTDVADVVEWILPQILKTFVSTDEAVRFDPETPDDEEQAEQESDYCNYVFYKQNSGFLNLYSFVKDGLIEKVGTVKNYWDASTKVTTESYTNLTEVELAELLNDDEVEPTAHTPHEEFGPMGEPIVLHDLELERTEKNGVARTEPVPPEEFFVNSDHNSIDVTKARFVAQKTRKTVSELVEMGFDFDEVKDLPSYDYDDEDNSRNTVTDETYRDDSYDKSQRIIELYDCYPLMDMNEDGIAERRRVLYVKGSKILENEPADCVPFACWSPIIMPHRFVGKSIYDRMREVQKQKTQLWRQIFDNLYLTNNQRTYVNMNSGVSLDDLLMSRPGGIVRGEGPYQEAMASIVTPPIGAPAYQMLEYLDKTRTERTGVGPDTMGQNMNISGDTAHGIERLMSAKEELVGMIIRILGETGVKQIFTQIRALLAKHQDKELVVKLRNKWVPINPSDWRERTSMTVKVGLGTGDQIKKKSSLMDITMFQEKLVTGGSSIVNERNIYAAVTDYGKLCNLGNIDAYFTDPASVPPKPPKEDPAQKMIDAQMAIEEQKNVLKAQEQKSETQNAIQEIRLKQNEQMRKWEEMNNDLLAKMTELELQYLQNIPGSAV